MLLFLHRMTIHHQLTTRNYLMISHPIKPRRRGTAQSIVRCQQKNDRVKVAASSCGVRFFCLISLPCSCYLFFSCNTLLPRGAVRDETTKGCVGEQMLTCVLSSFRLYQPCKLVLLYTNEFNMGHSALNGPIIADRTGL